MKEYNCIISREDVLELKRILDHSLVRIKWDVKRTTLSQNVLDTIVRRVRLQTKLAMAIKDSKTRQ